MPPPVTLASSTRQALRRITAKDPIHPAAIVGKFWDQTESDCEELGDADALPRFFPRTASAAPAPPITGPSPAPAATATACQPIPKPSPRRVRGKLAGVRVSIGLNFKFQILDPPSSKTGLGPSRRDRLRSPRLGRLRDGLWSHRIRAVPRKPKPPRNHFRGPRRRVVNPTIIDAAATCAPSYLEVLMAGGDGGRRGGRGAPGSGGADRRRGRGRAIIDDGRGRDDGQGHRGRGRGGPMHNSGRGGPAPSAGRGGPPPAGPPPAGGRGNSARGGRNPRHAGGEADKDQGPNSSATEAAVVEQGQAEQEEGKKRKRNTVKKVCTICTDEHFTNLCPLLRGPKPSVALCGAAEDGMGFFQIQGARNNQIVETSQSSIAALVTVKVGKVSAQLLQAELARIIPVRWDWEVQQLGANSYVVPFPSKEELDRMIAIDTINTKNKEGTISFAEFVDDVQPIKVLEQAWGTIVELRRRWTWFISGNSQARILVAVFDPKKIPVWRTLVLALVSTAYFSRRRKIYKPTPVLDPSDEDLLSDKDLEEETVKWKMRKILTRRTLGIIGSLPNKHRKDTQNVPPMQQANLVDEALDLALREERLYSAIALPPPPPELVSLAAPIDIGCGLVGGSSEAALSSTSTAVETGIMTSVPAAVEEPEYAPAAQGRGPAPPPLEVTALMAAQGGGSATSTEETPGLTRRHPMLRWLSDGVHHSWRFGRGGLLRHSPPSHADRERGRWWCRPHTTGRGSGTTAIATFLHPAREAVETPSPAAPLPCYDLGRGSGGTTGASQAALEAKIVGRSGCYLTIS
ncbi:unnamed protein product [Miscanthus lutarioriparius]|uniref:Uncharacterized protein n=1 Tax=Miscanthus lutarioriparius TaxID=422564 RepID=A0A811R3E6_9POAL|nr:unnamed protein product [Miscanthus lutarioriparius]